MSNKRFKDNRKLISNIPYVRVADEENYGNQEDNDDDDDDTVAGDFEADEKVPIMGAPEVVIKNRITDDKDSQKSSSSSDHHDFDAVLQKTVGAFGPYQQLLVWLLCLPACFVSAFATFDMVFSAYTPNFTCIVPQENSSFSYGNTSIPPAFIISEDQCSYTVNRLINNTVMENTTHKCTKWSFSRQYLRQTLVTKFGLVCDRALEIRSIISLLNLCTLFAIFYSFLQDKIGRKRAFFVNLFFHVVFNVAASIFPRNVFQFAVFKFIAGVTCMWEICFCWALEFLGGPEQRTLVTTLMSVVYGLANMSVALVAWLCQDWDVFTFCTGAPFVLLVSFVWLVPESPRWLLSQNRVDEAAEIVCKLGRWNKSSNVDIDTVKQLLLDINSHSSSTAPDQPAEKQMTIGQFLRSKNLLYKNLLITLASVIANQLYGMIPYDSEHIFSNFYVAYLLPTSVELPAVILNIFLVNKLGRTIPLSGFLFLSAFCCLATWPLEYTGGEWSTVVLASMARFFISAGLAVQEQMAEELYPTVGRGVGTGISYIASSVTGLGSQFLIYSSLQWKLLPLIIMGGLTMATSFACLFLPDTFGKPLPDSVESAEAQGSVGCKAFRENVSCQSYRNYKKFS